MGKVILGAILGGALGLLIGWLPHWDAQWDIIQQGSRFTLPLGRLLQPLSMMIGTAAGAIVGAIAGRVAADPDSKPLPRWVVITSLAILVGIILLVILCAVWFFLPSRASDPGRLPDQEPVLQQEQKQHGKGP